MNLYKITINGIKANYYALTKNIEAASKLAEHTARSLRTRHRSQSYIVRKIERVSGKPFIL